MTTGITFTQAIDNDGTHNPKPTRLKCEGTRLDDDNMRNKVWAKTSLNDWKSCWLLLESVGARSGGWVWEATTRSPGWTLAHLERATRLMRLKQKA